MLRTLLRSHRKEMKQPLQAVENPYTTIDMLEGLSAHGLPQHIYDANPMAAQIVTEGTGITFVQVPCLGSHARIIVGTEAPVPGLMKKRIKQTQWLACSQQRCQ